MTEEVEKLHRAGLSWQKLEEFGLEYRYLSLYLQKKIAWQEMIQSLEKEIWHFAKRQMTWFKKDPRINWVKNRKEAKALLKDFLLF
jgi:tRNA dimethylallyltransferase